MWCIKGVCMRVNAINGYRYHCSNRVLNHKNKNVSFDGKHDCAKFFGGLMGALGTIGAIGGTIIMTGGLAIPAIIGYGAACTAGGAIIGHQIDKGAEEYEKNKNKNDNDKK